MEDEQPSASDWMESLGKDGPLISDPTSVLLLKAEYLGNANPNFLHGIEALNKHYEGMRRVRGDGNCFFRAFIFALCEQLLTNKEDVAAATALRLRILDKIRQSKAELIAIGYSEVAIDAFWETFVDYLEAMETRTHDELVQDFQTEGGECEYLVWYARLLTAGHLKRHAEQFQPFIEGLFPGLTVEQFCAAEVEPMGKECDQPQITALTEALQVRVKIEYLDGSTTAEQDLQSYICGTNAEGSEDSINIHVLYRPGHYDILYPRKTT
ncbi:hypothetical protein Poli38472_000255 [Pythium oligandrum]|uniref:ubiquitinyl hydrolase 1 n=1 Tax=Pythium oligandrum TaxID=41045 RepID=A0A8K1CBZ9_PYTOL|nr:hypothetical protein Poli38472_000255 [Pythium oligandrum]|eukprot:TMW60213.1 hypothetical protein Poli38472_000255 [Pythium oligandrum]